MPASKWIQLTPKEEIDSLLLYDTIYRYDKDSDRPHRIQVRLEEFIEIGLTEAELKALIVLEAKNAS